MAALARDRDLEPGLLEVAECSEGWIHCQRHLPLPSPLNTWVFQPYGRFFARFDTVGGLSEGKACAPPAFLTRGDAYGLPDRLD
jgi:hypothetical protein